MASKVISNFLESSTIHGLVHISTAKSRTARAAWVVIVVACFATAVYMINDSYMDWQESPVSTTITTHPITELEFPTVTVCPPRGSNVLRTGSMGHLSKSPTPISKISSNFGKIGLKKMLGGVVLPPRTLFSPGVSFSQWTSQ